MKTSIRLRLILALLLFVLVVGILSSLYEIASITRIELRATYRGAEVAAQIVTSQLRITLMNAGSGDLVEAVRRDARLATILRDARQITPAVTYVAISDSLQRAIVHSDSLQTGRVMVAQPSIEPLPGILILRQAAAILREPGAYEVSVPLLADGRDFATVRLGLGAEILRADLESIVRSHIWRLLAQLLMAVLLGATISWLLIHRPLRRIEQGLMQLQGGDLGFRFPTEARNELSSLMGHINALSEHLATERGALLSRQEHLASEGDAIRQAVDALDDGMLTLDGEARVVMANRPACRILGATLQEVTGHTLAAICGRNHPLTRVAERSFAGTLKSESVQVEMDTEEGPRVFITTCQLVGDSSAPEGALLTLRDYGRVRRLQELVDHAHVLSRLGRMAAGVAHEVRNPLNAMNIHLELLKQDVADNGSPKAGERIETVQREIARMERVIFGFLKLTRLKELSLGRVKLEPLVRDLVLLVEPEARMAGVEFEFDATAEVPDIYGDEEVLRQALLNVFRNAIQASRPGSLPVKVSLRSEEGGACLQVQDHGQGIAAELHSRIFDLYFTTKKDGTGVGLALVQQAVEMHGGTITVRSEPDRGALFTICFPALIPA